jgi:hypothetical protein
MTKKSMVLAGALAAVVATAALGASAGDGDRVVIAERNTIVTFDPEKPLGNGRALLEGDHVLTSPTGRLVLRSRVTLSPFPAPRVTARGTWRIVEATGGYAGLEGSGKSLAVGDFTTATATIMRDGEVEREKEHAK